MQSAKAASDTGPMDQSVGTRAISSQKTGSASSDTVPARVAVEIADALSAIQDALARKSRHVRYKGAFHLQPSLILAVRWA